MIPHDQCPHKLWRLAHPGVWECLTCKVGTAAIYQAPYPRTSCCVPFCRRTSTRFSGEWICADHWKLVPMALKRFRTKRLKAIERIAARREDGSADQWSAWIRYGRIQRAIWRRMKAAAIHRATGL